MTEPEPPFLPTTPGNQSSLPLDAPPLPAGTPLLPARMVNDEIQCRLLGRHLLGEIDRYPSFTTR